VVKFEFYPLEETKKTNFFAKKFIGKRKISKSRGALASLPPCNAHASNVFY